MSSDISEVESELVQILRHGELNLRTDNAGPDRLTNVKANDIKRRGYKVTGHVLTDDDGHSCIVDKGAVKWLKEGEWWELMHGS